MPGERKLGFVFIVLGLCLAAGVVAYSYAAVNSGEPVGTLWSMSFRFTPGVTVYSPDDNGIGPIAISQNDSMVVAGTGASIGNGSIYAFSSAGVELWSHSLNHTVSAVSMSSSGSVIAVSGYEVQGPAGTYGNPALFVFSGNGTLLWHGVYPGQSVDAQVTSDGTRLVLLTEGQLLYMTSEGVVLWTFDAGAGTTQGFSTPADGNNVTLSVLYSPSSNATQKVTRSLLVFDSGGTMISNTTTIGTVANPPPPPGAQGSSTTSATTQCEPAIFLNGSGNPSRDFLSADGRYAVVVSNWDDHARMFFAGLALGEGCSR